MNNILVIIKKELKRVFTDYRMVMSIFLPGIMIFIMYTIIGNVTSNMVNVNKDYTYKVVAIDEPVAITTIFETLEGYKIEFIDQGDKDLTDIKNMIKNEEIDLYIKYNGDFNSLPNHSDSELPYIDFIYNSVRKESQSIYSIYMQVLNEYEGALANAFNVNVPIDMATKEEQGMMFISTLMPYLLIIFLFSGAMALVPESIAGEKERGTIATLLVTPLKRRDLALGKIISLSIVSILGAISSFIGILLSLPKLAGGLQIEVAYSVATYAFIAGVIISLVVLIVSALAVISTFAKSVKEATSYSGSLLAVVTVVGVVSMFGAMGNNVFLNLIPLYNGLNVLSQLFNNNINVLGCSITIVSNLVYTGLLVVLLTRMFNSEKIMFNK